MWIFCHKIYKVALAKICYPKIKNSTRVTIIRWADRVDNKHITLSRKFKSYFWFPVMNISLRKINIIGRGKINHKLSVLMVSSYNANFIFSFLSLDYNVATEINSLPVWTNVLNILIIQVMGINSLCYYCPHR
jgi:hypothetical protein